MYTTPSNVINTAPDFLIGVEGGSPVLVPRGIALAGPTGTNDLTTTEIASAKALLSGDRTPVASSRDITADDNGKFLTPTGTLTLTIPAGLSPMPSFTVDCPASGTVSIARSTTATLNGAGATLTRTRANNPVGFVVLAHESDAYGVSGA